MKTLKAVLTIFACVLIPMVAAKFHATFGPLAGIIAAFVLANLFFGSYLAPVNQLGTPTLITNLLTGKIIKPLRTAVPELGFFSVDWGQNGGEFAPPVKFGHRVVSHMLAAPAAERFTPGSGLGSNTNNPKDLLTDASVLINLGAKVSIKLPVADAVKYLLDPAFKATLEEATVSLGRFVVSDAVAKYDQARFSQELRVTKEAVELDKIGDVRAALNKLGTRTPRFILGETDWVKNLSRDPVVASGDYHGQRTGEDPYITLVNIEGFSAIREFPNMPTNSATLSTFTAVAETDVITVSAAHGLAVGDRVRVTTSAADLPLNLAIDTDYFVKTVPSSTTLTLSATRGGGTFDIGDTGSGTHTIAKFEALNAMAFERRAIHIAFRHLLDNSELARQLGIPETSKKVQVNLPGAAPVTWHFWEDATGANPTGDVYATAVVAYGITAGREIADDAAPGEQAAGAGMDYGAIRLVETAKSA